MTTTRPLHVWNPDTAVWDTVGDPRMLTHSHPSNTSGRWRFQSSTAAGDPGSGNLRCDSGSLPSAAELRLSHTTGGGVEGPQATGVLAAGDVVYVQDQNDNTRWTKFSVAAAPTRLGTYTTIPVAVLTTGAAVPNNQDVEIIFHLAGGGGGGGGADVTITTDASLTATESPANTFALAARLSPDAGNALALRANGLYATDTTGGGGGGLATDPLADAKGDLFAASGADAVGRLPLGGNGQVLTADSAQALGVKWADAAGGGGGDFVEAAGDTMTGALTLPTAILSAPASGATARVYGATSPALSPTGGSGSFELGMRFRTDANGTLTAVHWYRSGSAATPTAARVWDSTTPGTAVRTLSAAERAPWAEAGTGWKTATLSSPLSLVPGREYAVSYTNSGNYGSHGSYTPVPDSPLVFLTHGSGTSGAYPGSGGATSFLVDAAVEPAAAPVAAGGVVRLANGSAGAVAWRNAGNTADLPLTVNASNELTFNGVPIGAGGAYLPLAGGTLTGDLTLSEATPAVALKQAADTQPRSRLTDTALAFGPGGATAPDATLSRTGPGVLAVGGGLTLNPGPGQPSVLGGPGGNLLLRSTAPHNVVLGPGAGVVHPEAHNAVALGAPANAWSAVYAQAITLQTPAGQPSVVGGAAANLLLRSTAPYNIVVGPGAGVFHPEADNTVACGAAGVRWTAVSAVAGTINTSSRAAKEGITPLDPQRALEAVRNTPAVTFTYKAPPKPAEAYDLPDDPAEAQAVLEQQLRSAPLEAAARQQAGFVAEDCDDLLLTGEGQTNPSNTCGVLLAALQALDARLSALEGA